MAVIKLKSHLYFSRVAWPSHCDMTPCNINTGIVDVSPKVGVVRKYAAYILEYVRPSYNDEQLVFVVQNTKCAGQTETGAFISGDKQTSNNTNPCEEAKALHILLSRRPIN